MDTTDYIADVRSLYQSENGGLPMLALDPVPGFRDHADNLVIVGDWVMVGVGGRSSYGPRLARVLAIEPRTSERFSHYEDKPREEWTDWEVRYYRDKTWGPQVSHHEPYICAQVTVAQFPDMAPATRPIRRVLTISQCLKYTGKVPFDLA